MDDKLPTKDTFDIFLKNNEGLVYSIAYRIFQQNRFVRNHKLDFEEVFNLTRYASWLAIEHIKRDIETYGKARYALGTYTNMHTRSLIKRFHGNKLIDDKNLEEKYDIEDNNHQINSVDDDDLLEYLQKGLSIRDRDIVIDRIKNHLTLAEIADKNNLSIEAIRIIIIRTIDKMREKYEVI